MLNNKNKHSLTTALENIKKYTKGSYFYVTLTIRRKLIAIISLTVFVSIAILIYIALAIFEENMTNMIIFLQSKATGILANEVSNTINSYQVKTIECTTFGDQENLRSARCSDFLYLARFSSKKNETIHINKQLINDKLLKKLAINRTKFKKEIRNLQAHISRKEFYIRNITSSFNRVLWLMSIPHDSSLYVSVIQISQLYNNFSEKSTGGSESIYTSYLVNSDGNLILHPKKDALFEAKNILSHPVVSKMYEGKARNGVLRFTENNNKYFGSFERLDHIGIGVISSIPEKMALEGVNAVRWGSVLIAIIILSVAILFIYFFSDTIARPLQLLSNAAEKISNGEYEHKLQVKTRDEVGELTKVFNLMAHGLQEREKLKGALNKFVNEEIANQVLQGEIKLGGERKEATILFMDIRGFTAISEKLQPEEVVDFLNEYMTLMVGIISDTGGVVDKFIGDAIMAIWGAPVTKGNDIENCLNATLMMRKGIVNFNTQRKKKKQFPIMFGCGINTGPVVSGQIGSPDRHEYTVIGDTVNLASRIEALSKHFAVDILITDNTYQLVKNIFSVAVMNKVKVKGKSKTQKFYALLGRKDDPQTPENIETLRKNIGTKYEPASKKSVNIQEKKYEII